MSADCPHLGLSMAVALDNIEVRVRRLLAPPPTTRRTLTIKAIGACALLMPMIAVPLMRWSIS